MAESIVVTCRMNGEDVSRLGARYLERVRALTQRAEAAGATLAAWGATMVTFAFDVDSLEEALELVAEATRAEEPWSCGIARGPIEPLADHGGGRADLAWGEPLVVAEMLARASRSREALVDATFPGLDELIVTGRRLAHDGERLVRGVRIDARRPWKRDLAAAVEQLAWTPWVGDVDLRPLLARAGAVHVVRADPGHGGSRALAEIAAAAAPGPTLLVTPFGASVEPLGALRRAVMRALAVRPYPSDPELAPVLDMFLGGIGASIEQAAAIVGALLRPLEANGRPGVLLLDDAGEIDAESLEACAQVIAWMAAPFHVVARIDATDSLPGALATLPRGIEVELPPLERAPGEALARGAVKGELDARAARRFARRAGFVPLAVVEAIALGLARGDLAIHDERVTLRKRASFAGPPAPVTAWIKKRAKLAAPDERGVLACVALFGGEAHVEAVTSALTIVESGIAVEDEVKKLVTRRSLVATQPGWVALPSRSHRDTIADLLDESPRRALHHAIADVLEQNEGELACAEAAHHAVKAGEGERGARLALRAARAAARAGMSKSASRLLTLARLADPKCEPLTRQQLLTSLPPPQAPSSLPPSAATIASATAYVIAGRAPVVPPAPSAAGERAVPRAEPTVSRVDRPALRAEPPSTFDDQPTEQRGALTDSDVPAVLASASRDDRDSDGPTIISPPEGDRPTTPDAPRASSPSPLPAPIAPRPRAATPPAAPAALPKPLAPPPLRPSLQGMSAVLPRAAAPPVVRPSRQMEAVRPAAGEPARPHRPPPPAPAKPSVPIAAVKPPLSPSASSNGDQALASRLVDLARGALLEGDAAAVEKWVEGLRAAGDHDRIADRIEALARLARGQIGDALRALREAHEATGADPAARAQASLAFALALTAARRDDEALLAGLDALARAREARDPRAAEACLAFLAKLYARVDRKDEAAQLKAAAIRR